LRRQHVAEVIEIPAANAYGLEADNLAAAIRGAEPALLGRDDALGQARAIEALYASADSGAPVSPPST
jgi:predicted dehydrogenase